MDDKKNISYGLDGDKSYGLNDNTGYGLNGNNGELNLAKEPIQASEEERKEYDKVRAGAAKVAYDTMREDSYKDRVQSNLDAVSIGQDKVPNPEYNREYTKERAESLLNSLNPKKEENNPSASQEKQDTVKIVKPEIPVVVKKKQVQNEKFQQKIKEAISKFLIVASLAGAGAVMTTDVLLHPENYSTTYDEYVGPPKATEIIDRIDDNYREIKDTIKKGR